MKNARTVASETERRWSSKKAWRASNHADQSRSDGQRSPRNDDLDLGKVSSTTEFAGVGLS